MHAVVGTTGFSAEDLARYDAAFATSSANALIAANFAIGAVLMMRFAELAAPWFETAEIIELHHDAKADAPSGTAVVTAQRMAEASGEWAPDPTRTVIAEGARGVVAVDRDPAGLETLAATHGDRVRVVVGDVREWSSHEAAVATARSAFGRLDAAVGNAGVFDFHRPLAK